MAIFEDSGAFRQEQLGQKPYKRRISKSMTDGSTDRRMDQQSGMNGYRSDVRVGKGSDKKFFSSFLHFRDQTTLAHAEQKIALFAFRIFKEMP